MLSQARIDAYLLTLSDDPENALSSTEPWLVDLTAAFLTSDAASGVYNPVRDAIPDDLLAAARAQVRAQVRAQRRSAA